MNVACMFIKRGEGLDLHIREDMCPQTVGYDNRGNSKSKDTSG